MTLEKVEVFYRDGTPAGLVSADKFDKSGKVVLCRDTQKCSRCGGAGGSDAWKFTGWTCYRCGGTGEDPKLITVFGYTAERVTALNSAGAKRAATKAKKAAEKAAAIEAEKEANRAVFNEKYGELLKNVEATKFPENGIVADILSKAKENVRLSDAQAEVLKKHLARVAEEAAKPASEFVGEVGGKIEVSATVERKMQFERASFSYPYTELVTMVVFRTIENSAIVWYANNTKGIEKGDVVTIRAKVKEHTEYKGEKQTKIYYTKIEKMNAGD